MSKLLSKEKLAGMAQYARDQRAWAGSVSDALTAALDHIDAQAALLDEAKGVIDDYHREHSLDSDGCGCGCCLDAHALLAKLGETK